MATRKRYRLKKRIKNFIFFYSFIGILFVASYTLSRYVQTTEGTGGIDIAKFKVSVNNKNITDGNPFILNYKDITNTSEKIAPNTNGYFEFTIDPTDTEVSLEYEFHFDISQLDKDFKLNYYTINDDTKQNELLGGNILKNDLLLPTTDKGFTEKDKVNIKVYWSWDTEDITNPNINDYDNKNIEVIATIKQKIE